jgi:hypothetical protein
MCLDTLQLLLALASICEWKADVVNVVGAYLNGTSKNKFTCDKSLDMRMALIQFAYSKEHFTDYDSPEESGTRS